MAVEDARLREIASVGPREAPGVRQLQADQKVCARSEALLMRRDQATPQLLDGGEGLFIEQQLMRVGTAIRANGNSLAAPDQFGAALSKMLPAPGGQVRGPAVGGAVPSFHRQHTKSIPDWKTVELIRLLERRFRAVAQLAIEAYRRTELLRDNRRILPRF